MMSMSHLHLGCDHVFQNKRGLDIHIGTCQWQSECGIDRIIACRGVLTKRQFLVRWTGYNSDEDKWLPRSNLHPDVIKEFEQNSGNYDYDWQFRCDVCDLPCSSSRGVKIHKAQKHKPAPTQKFAGSLADKVVKFNKIKQQQSSRPHVICNGIILENVYCFKYLGTLFTADADQMKDIKARIA